MASEIYQWTVSGFKHVTAPTNVRTMIRLYCATSQVLETSLPILSPASEAILTPYRHTAKGSYLLAANLNAFAFRFCHAPESQGTEPEPVHRRTTPRHRPRRLRPALSADTTARALVRDHVLRLTYTAHDMAPFARDLGYHGTPFAWDADEPAATCAPASTPSTSTSTACRGTPPATCSTPSPSSAARTKKQFGHYRTRALILAYMNALAAGDTETRVAV